MTKDELIAEGFKPREIATPHDHLRATCEWELGDPSWASTIIEWLRDAGYTVTDIPVDAGEDGNG